MDFALIFKKSYDILSDSSKRIDKAYNMQIPELPEINKRIFAAASNADIFAAMGS